MTFTSLALGLTLLLRPELTESDALLSEGVLESGGRRRGSSFNLFFCNTHIQSFQKTCTDRTATHKHMTGHSISSYCRASDEESVLMGYSAQSTIKRAREDIKGGTMMAGNCSLASFSRPFVSNNKTFTAGAFLVLQTEQASSCCAVLWVSVHQ